MVFEEQIRRMQEVTGKQTQAELAEFLGVCPSSVSDAGRRGKIPSGWLLTLMWVKGVLPEWVLTGNGPCFIAGPSSPVGCCETGDAYRERTVDEEALRRLSSRALADELVRRIAVSQAKMLCPDTDA